ncbi:MAG TPA: hypothetical protein VNK43_10215 [Gemmatimonadales bacterium]|nr:hypothetical protein [Gemmatimonadales bacterium]
MISAARIPVFALALAAALPLPRPLAAQGVLVAPHAVFIDHQSRSGSILLYNPNTEPAEVTVSTTYGYPVTDSAGRMLLNVVDAPDSTAPSAAGWVQAFPRRVTVGPLERQTIRLLATPPAGLPDGEYWARLVIAARGGSVPVEGVPDSTAIQVGLTLEVRTVIALLYRKGAVETGVRLSNLRAAVSGDSLEVRGRLERRGNAAFVGSVWGTLVDAAGRSRAEFTAPLAVYYDLEPRFTAPVERLEPGRYWLRLRVAPEREDLSPKVLLPAPPVSDSVEVTVP